MSGGRAGMVWGSRDGTRRRLRAGGVLVAVAGLILASTPAWAADIDPQTGPVTGGTTVTIPLPEQVRFTTISAGGLHTLAVGTDGNVYAWGRNDDGQLGDGTTTSRSTPVTVHTPAGVTFTDVSAGWRHSLALTATGRVYSWGDNTEGQLGSGTLASRLTPGPIFASGGLAFTDIDTGREHSVALTDDGEVYAWGDNANGQLGDGTTTDHAVPLPVYSHSYPFDAVSAGGYHTLALGREGNTYAWGSNVYGQLGDDSTTNSNKPVQVKRPNGKVLTAISAGLYHSVAISADGHTYAWGRNSTGQLGDGTTVSRDRPVAVTEPAGVAFTAIDAGDRHTVATAHGTIGGQLPLGYDAMYAWGSNPYGQLGDGTTTDRHTPTFVRTFFPSVRFSAGGYHSIGAAAVTGILAWGRNGNGQLGMGTTSSRQSTPTAAHSPAILTGVDFGGEPADPADFAETRPGRWSVVTPPHDSGLADVTVQWSMGGEPQPDVHYVDQGGFRYTCTPFPDVTESSAFCEDIAWLADTGITGGKADGLYHAGDAVSRGQMAAYLYRYEHGGAAGGQCSGAAPFPDVSAASTFCEDIAWLKASGITGGKADGLYHAGDAVSRGQMAAYLYRYEHGGAAGGQCSGAAPFPDVPAASTFCEDIAWLASTGITQGKADGLYHAADAVSRGQMAAYLHRMSIL